MSDVISRNGYFYDLKQSPYEVVTPKGITLKIPSFYQKQNFEKQVNIRVERVKRAVKVNKMEKFVDDTLMSEIVERIYHTVYSEKNYYDIKK